MVCDGRSIPRRSRRYQAGRCTPCKESSTRTRSHWSRDLFGTPGLMVLLRGSELHFSSMPERWCGEDLAFSTIWAMETSAPLPSSSHIYAKSLFPHLNHCLLM